MSGRRNPHRSERLLKSAFIRLSCPRDGAEKHHSSLLYCLSLAPSAGRTNEHKLDRSTEKKKKDPRTVKGEKERERTDGELLDARKKDHGHLRSASLASGPLFLPCLSEAIVRLTENGPKEGRRQCRDGCFHSLSLFLLGKRARIE